MPSSLLAAALAVFSTRVQAGARTLGLAEPTTFRYDLPRAERVRLEVFDLNGRRVRALVWGEVAAGQHRAEWDGTDAQGRRVAAGIYPCRLLAGSFSATRRVVLLRSFHTV